MRNKLYKIGTIAIIFVTVIYMIIVSCRHGFGIDELDWTLRFVDGKSLKEICISLASFGYNLPLFYIIIKILDMVFHHNEFMLLLPSMLMTIIGCYYIYITAKKYFETKFSLLVVPTAICSSFFFRQIACALRPYSLLFMLSAMSYYYYFKKMKEENISNHLKFIIIITELVFTHWYGALLTFCYGITDFYFLIKKKLKFRYFILYVIPFILILLWVIYVFKMHIITFTKYWAHSVNILIIMQLLFKLLNINLFSIIILIIVLKKKKLKLEKSLDYIKIKVTLYEIICIIIGIAIYSNFISPTSSLWVNRYFIAFLPQIIIIFSFYLVKLYCIAKESDLDDINKNFIRNLIIINFFCSIILTFYISFYHPNIEFEMPYIEIFKELKKDKDIYKDDTLIICTYGKYWIDYYLFETDNRLPSNVLVIDPYKYGNTNSEKAKIEELEYVIKDSKICNEKFDINQKYNYKKIYIMELHRMLLENEVKKIIDIENYDIDFNEKNSIVKLVRNED